MDVTVYVLQRILRNLGVSPYSYLYFVAVKSMFGGKIVYPDDSFVNQTNGQLMGHPLSFPILCIINLSTYLRVKSLHTYEEVKDLPFLINGDDILFRESNPDQIGDLTDYGLWRRFAGDVGLIVNELKTYVHPQFNMINSIRHFGDRQIYYQNIALAIGHRVKSDPMRLLTASGKIFEQLQQTKFGVDHLCRSFLRTLSKRLPKRRLKFGKHDFIPNFFLPRELGGLGLSDRGKDFYVTYPQRRLAQYLIRNPCDWVFQERYFDLKTSSKAALKAVKPLLPSSELWIKNGKSVQGPFGPYEDYKEVCKSYLGRTCQLTSYVQNKTPTDENYVFRVNLRNALKSREKPICSKKLKKLQVPRWRVPGPVQVPPHKGRHLIVTSRDN
jgi:hypothetical protein